jgi:glycosyltransferase involved in cell wall biosynthesis
MSDSASSSRKIVVNLRSQDGCLTGVQRYSQELCARLNGGIQIVTPRRPLHGVAGHLWEQTVLPLRVAKRLLWSPANTGPLAVERQVLTIHDVAPLDHPEWFESKFASWYGWMIPALARRLRYLITVSEFSKRRLIAHAEIEQSRVQVIPNGVSERFYPRDIDSIRDARTRLRIPTDHYVLSLGSIEPRKNLSRLLQAWSLCAPRLPDDVWLVVAGAEGKGHIFATATVGEIPPRVHWTGFVQDEDLPALYSGAMAMVYPSIYEGFGLPVLEAMAAGTAAIAGNSTALPEVMDGAGVLVDPYDVSAIAAAMERIVQDREWRERLRRSGIERSRHFSWDRAAASTMRVLESAEV